MEPEILNDRYRLEELLGTGGMATVYRGHDLLLDRPVAIKFLREPYAGDPAFRGRFLEEARAASRLDHPNVVHVYDAGIAQEKPYIVMELVAGQDLKTLIRQKAPLPVPQALSITRQICAGVGHAHRASLIHCDLKPQNILVTPHGEVKVTDFGIARAFQEGQASTEKEKAVWGSPHYISPEQAAGEPPLPASDVYSIGIMLYEMLTGVPPFHADDPTDLIIKHLHEEPAAMRSLNPRIPPRLEWLVRKVLSKEPATRYRHADQFGMVIDEYLREGDAQTIPHPLVTDQTPLPPAAQPSPSAAPATPTIAVYRAAPESADATSGPDWLLWVLWLVAAIAVLGLIPLWWYTYRTYTAPTPPLSTATVTTIATEPAGETVGVPNLVGLSAADAQRRVEDYGLRLNVQNEQETPDALPGTVLEQTPPAGAQVSTGTTVNIVVAAGRAFTLPNVVGYRATDIIPHLETEGLIIVTEETWSAKPQGEIVKQVPVPDSEVTSGDTITLTISGGTEHPIPLQVNFNGQIVLETAAVPQLAFRAGDSIPVTLQWHALQPVERSYTVFVHLLAADRVTLIAAGDSEPVNGLNPTSAWQSGDIVMDPHQIAIPQGVAPGTYQIRVGLYTAEGRLPVSDAGLAQVHDNSIFVTTVVIQQ